MIEDTTAVKIGNYEYDVEWRLIDDSIQYHMESWRPILDDFELELISVNGVNPFIITDMAKKIIIDDLASNPDVRDRIEATIGTVDKADYYFDIACESARRLNAMYMTGQL